MKNLLCAAAAFLAVSLLSGCAATDNNTAAATPVASVCVMSGEALNADSPSVDFQGQKVGFCCEKCLGSWNKLDDAGKAAKLAPKK